MELTFVDRADPARTLTAPANSSGIDIGAKELREYFGIDWVPNLGDLLSQFAEAVGECILGSIPEVLDAEERTAIVRQLDKSSSEDPRKMYCRAVRRNPPRADGTPGQRSVFISQKTELLRSKLFAHLRQDSNVSFQYSVNRRMNKRTSRSSLAFNDHLFANVALTRPKLCGEACRLAVGRRPQDRGAPRRSAPGRLTSLIT